MKSLLIICDGMGDRLTGGKTPLEAADTPNMDKLAAIGINGIMDSVKTGIRPGSDTAHLSLLGYNPWKNYSGRGPLEAAGAGIELKEGDLAMRCNFGSVINNRVVDRRAGRAEYGLKELAGEIDGMVIETNHEKRDEKRKNDKKYRELLIYTDGASSGNPGPSGIGIVIKDKNDNIIKEYSKYIGKKTNNVAEYMAIIKALELAKDLGAEKLNINSDSNLLVKQVQGVWKINKPHLRKLYKQIKNLHNEFDSNTSTQTSNVSYKWIPREENRDADRLASNAIENKNVNNNTNNKIEVIFKKCSGHRGVVVFRGNGLSAKISDSDPEKEDELIHESKPLDNTAEAKFTAEILNKFTEKAHKILKGHKINRERTEKGMLPANALLARGVGIKREIESFEKKYGISAAAIAGMDLIKGICRTVGMAVIEVENATGHCDSNIGGKAIAAIKALKEYDFVFLHIKGTDEVSHDGNFDEKVKMIERVDREVISKILSDVDLGQVNVVLTCDHATPISIKQHTADPNPITIAGDVRTDLVKRFSERDCARGDLCRICGRDLINILLDLGDNAELFGA